MFKKIVKNLPELYLITAVLFYWQSTANLFNPIAMGLLVVLIFQMEFKKQYLGITIATIFIIANLYLILALISELREFTEVTNSFLLLISVGSVFIALNLIAGTALFKKNVHTNTNQIV